MPASIDMSYCGPPPLPDDLWERWNFDPLLVSILVVTTIVVLTQPISPRRKQAYISALAVLVVVFISPLCALTVALFSARVIHHVLLVAVAAPLLAWALASQEKKLAALLMPLAAIHAVTFWLWHAPDAYQLALTSTQVYWLMQVTLLGSATIFWSAAFAATPGKSIAALLLLTIQMGLLGALLVFSSTPLYTPHLTTTGPFGLSPIEDQQLAGLIMWVPAGIPYIAVGLWKLTQMLRSEAGVRV